MMNFKEFFGKMKPAASERINALRAQLGNLGNKPMAVAPVPARTPLLAPVRPDSIAGRGELRLSGAAPTLATTPPAVSLDTTGTAIADSLRLANTDKSRAFFKALAQRLQASQDAEQARDGTVVTRHDAHIAAAAADIAAHGRFVAAGNGRSVAPAPPPREESAAYFDRIREEARTSLTSGVYTDFYQMQEKFRQADEAEKIRLASPEYKEMAAHLEKVCQEAEAQRRTNREWQESRDRKLALARYEREARR